MEALYHQTNKLVQETQHLFSQLEKKLPNLDYQEIERNIESKITLINSNCERLDVLCMKGPISQRQNAKMRVDQLKYDSRHLNAALNSWRNQMLRRRREEAEREALLSRKFTTNDHIDIVIDHNVQHNSSLHNAVHGVDDLLQQGSSILDSLKSQKISLKGAHKRLIDIGQKMSFPSKEDRTKCWGRRDEYWKCLDDGKSETDCKEFRKQYEKFCPSQWVKHFDRKRAYLSFKEQIETGGVLSLCERKHMPEKNDVPVQAVIQQESVHDFGLTDTNLYE
ncbi:hypothetical protein KM043_018144 [Ampulex compressa]|nr:hypothetical protein KM043_018144 [Ampulex compressa]